MKSKFNVHKPDLRAILMSIIVLVIGVIAGAGIGINVAPDGDVVVETTTSDFSIELSDTQVPTLIENADGEVEEIFAPTIEQIDSKQSIDDTKLDFGQGAWHDISSPEAYKNSVIGYCTDLDGLYGAQCVDLSADFNYNYTGRWFSTCGTGAAYGLWDCKEYNAGDDYELIADATALQPGDIVVLGGGQYGHVGIALGYYNNGYIALLGQNQGGASCNGGGAVANVVNMSLKTFRGAFRPKMYIKAEPKAPETSTTSDCTSYRVQSGDTMSKIMLECEGKVEYGDAMNKYADSWYSTVVMPGQTVYDGWTYATGYGLYAGDVIERRGE